MLTPLEHDDEVRRLLLLGPPPPVDPCEVISDFLLERPHLIKKIHYALFGRLRIPAEVLNEPGEPPTRHNLQVAVEAFNRKYFGA